MPPPVLLFFNGCHTQKICGGKYKILHLKSESPGSRMAKKSGNIPEKFF